MDQAATHPRTERVSWLQFITLVLSVYVLIAVFIETVIKLSPATTQLLDYIDSLICLVFLYDFFFHLYHAPSKGSFLKWDWLDFISSIPMLGLFRFARLARVIRTLRILRAFRSSR
jgi:voltage-gated potassium channel